MKINHIFLLITSFLLITNCSFNKAEVDFSNKIKGNTVYFTIKNNSENKSIIFLKPKHNCLCYEDWTFSNKVYKDFFILGLDHFDYYKPTGYFPRIHKGLSDYNKIEIKKNEMYSDSISIPTRDTENCAFYPIINEETIVILINDTIFYK